MDNIIAKLKSAHKSFLVWFNGLVAAITLGLPYMLESFPAMQNYIPANFYKHGMVIIIIGNILLHFRPTQRAADTTSTDSATKS